MPRPQDRQGEWGVTGFVAIHHIEYISFSTSTITYLLNWPSEDRWQRLAVRTTRAYTLTLTIPGMLSFGSPSLPFVFLLECLPYDNKIVTIFMCTLIFILMIYFYK